MTDSASADGTAPYFVVLVGATFFMGSSFVAGKILLASVPPLSLVGWRFLLAALALLPLAVFAGRESLSSPARLMATVRSMPWLTLALIGLFQTTAMMGLLFLSLRHLPATTSAILLFTNPLWVALLARLYLAEPLTAPRMAGLGLGMAGVAVAVGGTWGGNAAGYLLALGAGLAWAAATVITKRSKPAVNAWTLSFWQMLFGATGLLALGAYAGETFPEQLSARDVAWFVWLAIPASAWSFGLWFAALQMGGAVRSSGFLFLTPLFTVLLSSLVLNADLTFGQAAGGALVGAALYLINLPRPRPSLSLDG